ncbi:hypothetical protein HOY82DRAFT_595293 [Tuber indicum]|nr:hypothetical protein HOY82DRAFT_595293 [Tuber indicum]
MSLVGWGQPLLLGVGLDKDFAYEHLTWCLALSNNEFGAIEESISKNVPESDANTTDSDVESDNFSETEGSTPWVGIPIPTEHATAGRSLQDVVRHETSEDELWLPFRTKSNFELARWFIEAKVPKDHIGRYFRKGLGPESSSIKSAYQLLEAVDELESGMGIKRWRVGFVLFSEAEIPDGEAPDEVLSTQKFFFREPIDCARYLLSQRCFAQDLVYDPVKEWNSEEPPQLVYSEIHKAQWWWETQDTLPDGATLVPIICGSDVTFLTNYSGDKKAWPIYMTIGNILSKTRNKASKHATVLLALLPVHPKMLGVMARDAHHREINNEILGDLMEAIFAPMVALRDSGIEVECADRKVRLCFPRLAAWIADHLENITLHGIQQNQCTVCNIRPEQLGSHFRRYAVNRDYRKYENLFQKYCDSDMQAAQELTDHGFKLLPSVFCGFPNVQQFILPKPDLLHVVYLGIFEAYLMKWPIRFLKKFKRLQSFDGVWKSLAAYPGYSAPNKEYSRISQWTGNEMRNLVEVILPCFAASLCRQSAAECPIFTHALTCVQSIVDFTLMSQYTSDTDETIQYLEQFLKAFHNHKDIFKEYRKDK